MKLETMQNMLVFAQDSIAPETDYYANHPFYYWPLFWNPLISQGDLFAIFNIACQAPVPQKSNT